LRGISSSILGGSRRKPGLLGVKTSVVVVVVVVMIMMMITAMNKTIFFSYRLLIAI
jgi:hypothetical protein